MNTDVPFSYMTSCVAVQIRAKFCLWVHGRPPLNWSSLEFAREPRFFQVLSLIFTVNYRDTEQNYRWENKIKYTDTQKNVHTPNILECLEKKPGKQESKHLWLTNFIIAFKNVDMLANGGGRLRWKAENEGFNVQKNGGYNMEHTYSRDPNASKVFYLLLQIAHMIFQLMEKGSLFRKNFLKGVGSQKNIAFRLLEAWRNLQISAEEFPDFYGGRYQIRFDTS